MKGAVVRQMGLVGLGLMMKMQPWLKDKDLKAQVSRGRRKEEGGEGKKKGVVEGGGGHNLRIGWVGG